jgi:uncharacterized iron-regulated membrane protein
MMSVTGLLLTYERQIVARVEQGYQPDVAPDRQHLSADELVRIARQAEPDAERVTVTYRNEPGAVVKVAAGRDRDLLVDPYSGEVLHDGDTAIESFFNSVMYLHRWFALTGESRAVGRAITGYSNLLFLYLLLSGIYLWLPRIWNRAILKTKILFNPRAKTGKARDFNWHHVFAFWAVVPLFFIVTTASVFYFSWANELVYAAYGETPPARGDAGSPTESPPPAVNVRSNEELLQRAISEFDARGITDWQSITMQPALSPGDAATFRADRSIGGQPAKVYNLELDSTDGSVTRWSTFGDNSPGSRARSTIRFLHTGEVFGVAGQTLAGVASLAACFLVWTGLALAWRRLVQPLLRKRAMPHATTEGAS